MLKHRLGYSLVSLAIFAAVAVKDTLQAKLLSHPQKEHIYDTGTLDGDTIYEDHNGLNVLACTSVDLDGKLHQLPAGHTYLININAIMSDEITFQLGAVPISGVNGTTNEALLAILIHRTKALNDNFPCDENNRAITYMENALALFEQRTQNRQERGVEGKLEV